VHLGHVIGGGELNIDPRKIEAMLKWCTPTNVMEVRFFVGATQYLRNFIASFSSLVIPLHL
jgi:hypothetical protein